MAPRSLITATRDRYIKTIQSVQPPSRWKILVVDSFTKQLLNSVLKMYDILQQNVSVVENIEFQRQPQPTFEAAYLLCPTSNNVERIIRDLAPTASGSKGAAAPTPQYAAGHVFFVDGLSDQLVQRLTSSPAEPKLRQLVELYTNFWPSEAQIFLLKTPQSFFTLFQPPGGAFGPDPSEALHALEEELQFATQAMLNVCVTLNEFPLIRYYNPSHPPLGPLLRPPDAQQAAQAFQGSARMARLRGEAGAGAFANSLLGEHFNKHLAMRLSAALDKYVAENEPKGDPGRPRSIAFITDRSMDTVAPFLHEFSYQAMCHDLLPIQDDKYSYSFYNAEGEREDKDAVLSDDDAVWQGIRHIHIAEAIEKLTKDFKAHAGEAGAFGAASSLSDMRDMLASLPHMQEMKDKLSLHLTMAQACMNKFEKSKLPAQAMVEQNCATRTTPEGQKPRTLVEEMVPLLDAQDVSNADKVRIIALYIMYADGVPDEDRKRLFQHARLGLGEMEAVNNLVHLGARVIKDSTNSGWDAFFKKGKRKQISGENEYELSRYQPLVQLMVEDHFAGRLDTQTYPYVKDGPPEASGAGGVVSGVGAGASGLVSSAWAQAGGGRDSPLARVGFGRGGSMASSSGGASARPQPSSLRSAKPTWHQKGRPGVGAAGGGSGGGETGPYGGLSGGRDDYGRGDGNRQRVFVFVAGGMTYSEVRSAYKISQKLNKDVYIGSSHVFTPEDFIGSIKAFGKATNVMAGGGGGRDRVGIPAGASHLRGPVNDVSGLRTTSRAAAAQTSPKNHRTPAVDPEASQNLYDRRFERADAPPSQSPVVASHAASSHHHNNSNNNSHHHQHQQEHHLSHQHSYENGGSRGGGGGGAAQSQPTNYAQHRLDPTSASSVRAGSPAPSSIMSDSGAKVKDKKKLKNLFSSKK